MYVRVQCNPFGLIQSVVLCLSSVSAESKSEALLILELLVPELFPEKVVTLCPALSLDFSVLALSPEQFLAVHPDLILRVQS